MKAILVRNGKGGGGRRRRRQVHNKGTYILKKGDEFEICTAGGGGYGKPKMRKEEKIELDIEDGLLSESYVRKNYRSSNL